MNSAYKLPQPPRQSVDPRTEGLRTFKGHTGGNQPVTVDNQGHYVYASTVYLILGALLLAAVVVGLFLKHAAKAGV